MADTLEEIYLDTLTPEDLTGGSITVATTDANTRYAIKDVRILNNMPALPVSSSLSVNGVGILSTTVSLETLVAGTEIVGANSAVVLSTDMANPPYYNISYKYYSSPSTYVSQALAGVGEVTTPTTTAYSGYTQDYRDIWESDASGVNAVYAIYSDGNSNAIFFKDGLSVSSSIYGAYVRTGNDVYELNTANPKIRKYNYITGVFDLFQNTLTSSLNSSYPRAAAYGNWIFWRWSASANIYGININFKTTVQTFSSTFGFNFNNQFFGVGYDSTTDKFVFLYQDHNATTVKLATTDLTVTELNALGATVGTRTTTDIYSGTPDNGLNSSTALVLKYVDGLLVYPTASLGFGFMDVATGVTSTYIKPADYPANASSANSGIGALSLPTITAAEALSAGLTTPSLTVRITGVKSTL